MDTKHAWNTVFCEHCGFTLSVPVYCKNRFCPTCGHHRNRLIQHKITTFMDDLQLRKFDSLKFLTLTIKNDPDLKRMTRDLVKSFRRLRQRAVWKKHVRGGCSVIEVKPGKEDWHVHLHIIIESAYIPFELLLAEWQAVSTGRGVYIKKLHGSQVLGYITKYLTKSECTKAEQERMTELLVNTRLFTVFGTWFDPFKRMKKLKFQCPACEKVHWFFGDRKAWFKSTTPADDDNYRRCKGLKPVIPDKQFTLTLESPSITVNVD